MCPAPVGARERTAKMIKESNDIEQDPAMRFAVEFLS
jgi:hypothetical protein